MTITVVQKAWTISPNVRKSFTVPPTIPETVGWFFRQNKIALESTTSQLNGAGQKTAYTRKWTSDGTTGPANAGDDTDRWGTDALAGGLRSTATTSPHSWGVWQGADGVQLLFDYVGSADNICRLAYSKGGLYTLAGTTTHSPTAADETVISNGNDVVVITATLDRVMHIWVRDDAKGWHCALYRSSTLLGDFSLARMKATFVSTRVVNPVFPVPYFAARFTSTARAGTAGTPLGTVSGTIGNAGHLGVMARVFTDTERNIRLGGGGIGLASDTSMSATFSAEKPALQGGEGSSHVPPIWSAESTANMDGFLGMPEDWWVAYTNSAAVPAAGDFAPGYQLGDNLAGSSRSNWLVALGSAIVRPWNNAAGTYDRA